MWKLLRKWRWLLPILAAAALALAVLKAPRTLSNSAENQANRTLPRLLEAPARWTRWLRESASHIRGMAGAEQRARKLEEELGLLRLEYRQLEEIVERDAKRGRNLELGGRSLAKLIPLNLLARDPGAWFKVILVDKGRDDGVNPGAGVVGPQGVMGKVLSSQSRSSKVLFLTDSSCRISVRLARSRVLAILAGDGLKGCRLEYLNGQDDVKVGDLVETAPGSLGFPSGIPAAIVTRVQKVDNGLRLSVDVEPAADLERLEGMYATGAAR
ncbi:MAG: rod shape-determining protein MreC [candidate division FCPU426 bacterium]